MGTSTQAKTDVAAIVNTDATTAITVGEGDANQKQLNAAKGPMDSPIVRQRRAKTHKMSVTMEDNEATDAVARVAVASLVAPVASLLLRNLPAEAAVMCARRRIKERNGCSIELTNSYISDACIIVVIVISCVRCGCFVLCFFVS